MSHTCFCSPAEEHHELLWLVLLSHRIEGRRLSWPLWLVTFRDDLTANSDQSQYSVLARRRVGLRLLMKENLMWRIVVRCSGCVRARSVLCEGVVVLGGRQILASRQAGSEAYLSGTSADRDIRERSTGFHRRSVEAEQSSAQIRLCRQRYSESAHLRHLQRCSGVPGVPHHFHVITISLYNAVFSLPSLL